jgi:hypothetical protein
MGSAKRREIPARPIGSHFGGMPIIAEQLSAFRDPEAQKVLYRFRTNNPDDSFIMYKIRQFGGRPDSPIAIGSRQHAALEKALAEYTPRLDKAILNRTMLAAKRQSYGLPYSPRIPAWRLIDKVPAVGEWLQKKSPFLFSPAPRIAQRLARYLAGRINPDVVDPKNLADLLKLLPSRVRK